MAQSTSSTSAASDKFCVPIGQNLGNVNVRTKIPSPGALAYNSFNNRLYYGDSDSWNILGSGDGDVTGPNGVVSGHVAGFADNSGKVIYDTGFTLSGNSSGTNTGDVTLTTFGNVPNANGASLVGQQLQLQPADDTNPGGVSTSTQSFAGVKNFVDGITFSPYSSVLDVYSKDVVSMDFSGAVNPVTLDVTFERIGDMCYASLPKVYADKSVAGGGAGSLIIIAPTTTIPAQYIPASTTSTIASVYFSASPFANTDEEFYFGLFNTLATSGTFRISAGQFTTTGALKNFTNGGTGQYNGVLDQTIAYKVT